MLSNRERSNGPTEKESDEALVAAIARRDARAMEVLFARHSVSIYRFIMRLIGDASLAEDIVSEVFLGVWRGADKFKAASQVSTWLFAIARNKTVSACRHHLEFTIDDDVLTELADAADDPETRLSQRGRSILMRECLMRLPAAQREVIDLVYYHEKSIAEVALIVGIPSGTVKTRMFRARGRMAELLKGAGVIDCHMV